MIRLLIATRNAHKVGEIQAMLGAGFQCRALGEFPGSPEVVEDASTFAGNATKKAAEIAAWLSSQVAEPPDFVLADDSGLEVDALGGAPGIYSARFAALGASAAGNSPDAANNAKLLRLLAAVAGEQRTARFRCVMALVAVRGTNQTNPAAQAQLFDGVCEGRIGWQVSGAGGFGYDPLFTPLGYEQTFAEIGAEVKNGMSHRAAAVAKLKRALAG